MSENEVQEVLDELNTVRPEKLNHKAKRLFEAIMKIADERDAYKRENEALKKKIEYYRMTVDRDCNEEFEL